MENNKAIRDIIGSDIKNDRKIQIFGVLIFILILLGISFFQGKDSGTLKIQWTETELTVTDPAGQVFSLELKDLQKLSFHTGWEPGTCVQGGENSYYRYGIWDNETLGNYRLYAAKKSASVILLESASEKIAISYESDKITAELYRSLEPMLNEQGFSPEYEKLD